MSEVIDKKPRAAAKSKDSAAAPAPLTLGASADKIWALREEKRVLDAAVKVKEKEIEAMTESIFALLDAQDSRKAEGKKASISITSSTVPNATDWDAFFAWVVAGKRGDKMAYVHLLRKQIGAPAYNELRSLGVVVPGQQDFTKRSLSITSL